MEPTELLPIAALDELRVASFGDLDRLLSSVDPLTATKFMNSVVRVTSAELRVQDPKSLDKFERAVSILTKVELDSVEVQRMAALFVCVEYFHRIGQGFKALSLLGTLLPRALAQGQKQELRRLHNMAGVVHTDLLNYPQAMEHFEQALLISRELHDRELECAVLANATRVLRQMGLYHDAIAVAETILDLALETAVAREVRFQVCGIGLFCAHRLHDHKSALRFMTDGGALAGVTTNAFNRAAFEHNRAHYLIDCKDFETAEIVLAAAKRDLAGVPNPRVKLMLAIPAALCEWASRDRARVMEARRALKELYKETRTSLLNFDDVLRALMKVHSNAETPEVAQAGMAYGKELVEFTTNHRRAKFYRQLKEQGVYMEPTLAKPFDPFANSRHWLMAEPLPSPPPTPNGPPIEKHEELTAIHEELAHLRTEAFRTEIKTLAYATAENWALAAEFFDDNTGKHCFRVGYLAGMLARQMNLDPAFCVQIEHAARLHDIGKIAVNEMILLKPGRLDPAEMTAMRQHAQAGADMLEGTKDPTLQLAIVVAKYHHEWWNGTGYPVQLSHDTIPLPARITSLADVFDALTHERPYKTAWSSTRAIEEMVQFSGIQFDPHLVPHFVKVLDRYIPLLAADAIPGMRDLQSNHLMQSRRNLMDTIRGEKRSAENENVPGRGDVQRPL